MEPQSINQLVTRGDRSVSNSPKDMQQLSPDLQQRTMLVLQTYGNRENFMRVFEPKVQLAAGRDPEHAILSEKAPSLVVMKKAYGDNFPVMWLMQQILELVVYSNSKGTLNDYQAEFLANAIVNEYYYLKASELLLFFYQFKTGKYGRFYGVVDPMMITQALEVFVTERKRVIEQSEKSQERAEQAEWAKTKVSPEEWCRRVGLPECHSAIEVMRMRDRIINFIEGVVWCINLMWALVNAPSTYRNPR